MVRCGTCDNCVFYNGYKSLPKKQMGNERRSRSKSHPCTTVFTKKRRLVTEAETLTADTGGSRFRKEATADATFLAVNLPAAEVRSRPAVGAMALPTCDTEAVAKF